MQENVWKLTTSIQSHASRDPKKGSPHFVAVSKKIYFRLALAFSMKFCMNEEKLYNAAVCAVRKRTSHNMHKQ
jgi:hypothetical protein